MTQPSGDGQPQPMSVARRPQEPYLRCRRSFAVSHRPFGPSSTSASFSSFSFSAFPPSSSAVRSVAAASSLAISSNPRRVRARPASLDAPCAPRSNGVHGPAQRPGVAPLHASRIHCQQAG